MLSNHLKNYRIILGSASPRRKYLLEELGLSFVIEKPEIEEVYPPELPVEQIAVYLAKLKAGAIFDKHGSDVQNLIITADTIVVLNGEVIGKPSGAEQAVEILEKLSGHKHTVISGICFRNGTFIHTFSETTDVYFRTLSPEEIRHYIEYYQPFDKAGAYGIQEWIGLTGVTRIDGCFFNVMGLPVPRLYNELLIFTGTLLR